MSSFLLKPSSRLAVYVRQWLPVLTPLVFVLHKNPHLPIGIFFKVTLRLCDSQVQLVLNVFSIVCKFCSLIVSPVSSLFAFVSYITLFYFVSLFNHLLKPNHNFKSVLNLYLMFCFCFLYHFITRTTEDTSLQRRFFGTSLLQPAMA